jgi:transposase-like protein
MRNPKVSNSAASRKCLIATDLDPADSLLRKWFRANRQSSRTKIVEIGGRYGFASVSLAQEQPELSFEVRCDSQDLVHRGKALMGPAAGDRIAFTHVSMFDPPPHDDPNSVSAYVIRNLFWNWTDENVIKLLKMLVTSLRAAPSVRILVTDGVSPLPKEFPPRVEIAYRRRDITTMTMHNVKQRTQAEWLEMFARVDPAVKVSFIVHSSASNATNTNGGAGSNRI